MPERLVLTIALKPTSGGEPITDTVGVLFHPGTSPLTSFADLGPDDRDLIAHMLRDHASVLVDGEED